MHYTFVVILSCIFQAQSTLSTLIAFSNASTLPYTAQVCNSGGHPNICCIPLDLNINRGGFSWFKARYVVFSEIDSSEAFTAVYAITGEPACSGQMAAHRMGGQQWDTGTRLTMTGAGSALATDLGSETPLVRKWPSFLISDEVRFEFLRRSAWGFFWYRSAGGVIIWGREFEIVSGRLADSNTTVSNILSKGETGNNSDIL